MLLQVLYTWNLVCMIQNHLVVCLVVKEKGLFWDLNSIPYINNGKYFLLIFI